MVEREWQHHLQFGGTESLPLHLLLRPSFKSSKWNLERKVPLFFLTLFLQFNSWLLCSWQSLQKGTEGATFCLAVAWGRGMDHSLQHHQEVEQADDSYVRLLEFCHHSNHIWTITVKKKKKKGNNIEWGFQTYNYNIVLPKDFEFSLVVSWLLILYNLISYFFFPVP